MLRTEKRVNFILWLHDFLGRFIGKFPRRATEYLKRLCCQFSVRNVSSRTEKPSLIPVQVFAAVFVINGTDLYTMVNAIPGRKLPNCSYQFDPNREPTGFTHVNGKQP